jgi:hypothetical protein
MGVEGGRMILGGGAGAWWTVQTRVAVAREGGLMLCVALIAEMATV